MTILRGHSWRFGGGYTFRFRIDPDDGTPPLRVHGRYITTGRGAPHLELEPPHTPDHVRAFIIQQLTAP